ncbi:DgyrCDS11726 [Dimorphilus gyrociliatus]|uniref:DgyrCDS11726 n=1 Tax=Dimorphilus gyrociliatus TaxID=2664684 RepID=A0A7I8W5J4_9ANNE|nr:DgyrCDS11726 [Dimorphilus gyrociliatus]
MAPVDLRTNKNSIEEAYKKVCDVNSGTDWVIYGYEGKTSILKVDASGSGGFEEMAEDLNSGRIQYVYIRVQDPNSDLPKFVFINWQGEGAPDALKGSCANHVRDISAVLRGAHVSINARNEEDIEEDAILAKVAKSSVSSFRRSDAKFVEEPSGPVGTNYTKIRPNQEIRTNVRDAFWHNQQLEEERRKAEEIKRVQQEREALERERKEREERETHIREKQIAEKMKTFTNREKPISVAEEIRRLRISSIDQDDEQERASRAKRMQQERTDEARRLISQRSFQSSNTDENTNAPATQTTYNQPSADTSSYQRQDSSPKPEECWEPGLEETDLEKEPIRPSAQGFEPMRAPMRPPAPASEPLRAPMRPPVQESEPVRRSIPEPEPEPEPVRQSIPEPQPEIQPEELYEDTFTPEYKTTPADNEYEAAQVSNEPKPASQEASQGLKVKALYDYQATEEGEISFDPGDIITMVSQDYDGWWVGKAPNGQRGMFPSNYVEVID